MVRKNLVALYKIRVFLDLRKNIKFIHGSTLEYDPFKILFLLRTRKNVPFPSYFISPKIARLCSRFFHRMKNIDTPFDSIIKAPDVSHPQNPEFFYVRSKNPILVNA